MRVQEPIRLATIVLTSIILVLGNGCRSGINNGDSFWKSPSLPSFAFGKKKDDSVPKPPAVHFDPTPANRESELAAKNGATKNTAADLQNSLDKLAKSDGKASEKPESESARQGADQLGKTSVPPLRTPYQVSPPAIGKKTDKPIGDATSSQGAGLALKTSTENKLPESFKPAAANQLDAAGKTADQARAQFNSDMQSLKSSAKSNLGVAGSNISNSMTGLVTKAEEKIAGVSAQASNQVASVEPKLTEEQRRLEAEVARAKQEIVDLKKQLMDKNQMLAPIGSIPAGQSSSEALGAQSGAQSQATQLQVAANQDFQTAAGLRPNQALTNAAQVGNSRAEGPANQGGFAPLRPNKNVNFSTPGSPAPLAPTQYPTTSLGGFSAPANSTPTPKSDSGIQHAGHQSPFGSNLGNLGTSQESGSATADIEIPESVLRGSGSFSPGSVNRLRGN